MFALQRKMNFIELLSEHETEQKSIRNALSNFGITRWTMLKEPFQNLYEPEVIALMLNWIIKKHCKVR